MNIVYDFKNYDYIRILFDTKKEKQEFLNKEKSIKDQLLREFNCYEIEPIGLEIIFPGKRYRFGKIIYNYTVKYLRKNYNIKE